MSSVVGVPGSDTHPVRGIQNAVSERSPETSAGAGGSKPKPKPIPRDLPDQQAGADERRESEGRDAETADQKTRDIDEAEAGTGGEAPRILAAHVQGIRCPTNRLADAPRDIGAVTVTRDRLPTRTRDGCTRLSL